MPKNETKIRLEAIEGHKGCEAHKGVVDVLLSLDRRLGRMEVILIVAAACAVGSFGKDLILPLLFKLAGAS